MPVYVDRPKPWWPLVVLLIVLATGATLVWILRILPGADYPVWFKVAFPLGAAIPILGWLSVCYGLKYQIDQGHLIIHYGVIQRAQRIPLTHVVSAEAKYGVGGSFRQTPWLNDPRRVVEVRTSRGERLVLSPSNPEVFLAALSHARAGIGERP